MFARNISVFNSSIRTSAASTDECASYTAASAFSARTMAPSAMDREARISAVSLTFADAVLVAFSSFFALISKLLDISFCKTVLVVANSPFCCSQVFN